MMIGLCCLQVLAYCDALLQRQAERRRNERPLRTACCTPHCFDWSWRHTKRVHPAPSDRAGLDGDARTTPSNLIAAPAHVTQSRISDIHGPRGRRRWRDVMRAQASHVPRALQPLLQDKALCARTALQPDMLSNLRLARLLRAVSFTAIFDYGVHADDAFGTGEVEEVRDFAAVVRTAKRKAAAARRRASVLRELRNARAAVTRKLHASVTALTDVRTSAEYCSDAIAGLLT